MPASASVAKGGLHWNTRLGPRAALLLVVVELLAGATYALRMINLDASERVFLGDTIRLSCYYALQTVSGFEQAGRPGDQAHSHAPAISGGQKSKSIHTELAERRLFKSARGFNSLGAANKPADAAASRQPAASASKQVAGRGAEPLTAIAASEQLYAIKWYKDGEEFYRYLAQGSPKKQWLPMDGAVVDVERSDNQTVFLRAVSLRTSGHFRCEVSTDAPYFVTKSIERRILVYTQPSEVLVPPTVSKATSKKPANSELEYSLGDRVDLVCSAPPSKPATVLDWIINDSLNLSAISGAISSTVGMEKWPMLEVNNKRLVRLLSPINGSTGDGSAQVPHQLPGQQSPNPLANQTDDRILHNTKTVLYRGHQQHQQLVDNHLTPTIGVAETALDQLLELSISRLNFTIDTNLLQRLDLATGKIRPKLPERTSDSMLRLREIKTRLSSSRGTIETYAEDRLLSVSDKTFVGQTGDDSTGLSSAKRTQIKRSVNKYPSNPTTTIAGWTKSTPSFSRGGIPMNDDRRLSLKIECVSRFLHWNMSQAVKIYVHNKTRSVDNLNAITAQKRLRPGGKNSVGTIHRHPCNFLIELGMMSMVIHFVFLGRA